MAQSRRVKSDSATWKQGTSFLQGNSASGQGRNGQKVQPVMPIMPRAIVKEAGRGELQRLAECVLAVFIENETNVVPRSEHHDLAEKARRVLQCCVRRLPPANAPSDRSQPFRMFFRRPHTVQVKPSKTGVDVEPHDTTSKPFTPPQAVSRRRLPCARFCSASVRRSHPTRALAISHRAVARSALRRRSI